TVRPAGIPRRTKWRDRRGSARHKRCGPATDGQSRMSAESAKQPDVTLFGDELAHAAARFLKENQWFDGLGAIVRAHRDYTGHGLFHDHATGEFFLARSLDGLPRERLFTFPDEPGFTQWLAGQTDLAL